MNTKRISSLGTGFSLMMVLLVVVSIAQGQSGRTRPTPTPTPGNDESVKIITEEVKLNVVALDDNGKFFPGVGVNDLVITDNDILHQPSSVRRVPANVLIVMDTGGEMRVAKSLDQTKRTAKALIERLRDDDQIAVMQYSDKPEILTEWTSNKNIALSAVNSAKFGRRSMLLDALRFATAFLRKSSPDNKHLILITDGTDSAGRNLEVEAAFRSILSTDISVHVISYTKLELNDITPRAKGISKTPPPPAMPPEVAATLPNGVRDQAQSAKIGTVINVDRKYLRIMQQRKKDLENAEKSLQKIADDTGGEMLNPETAEEMIERTAIIAGMIDSSYVVTYTPKISVAESKNVRSISVTSKREGLVVLANRRLIAGNSSN